MYKHLIKALSFLLLLEILYMTPALNAMYVDDDEKGSEEAPLVTKMKARHKKPEIQGAIKK